MIKDKHSQTYNYCFYEYRISIIYDDIKDTFAAWLRHKDCGISILMFESHESTLARFKRLVHLNLSDYIKLYQKEYEK